MREDMARVIVERPRIKPYNHRKGRRQALEDLPTHEGLRKAQALRGERKQLNENLAPLHRYLARQVGRPWSKVYAEIAAHLRVDSAVQQHVRGHLHDFVAVTPRRNIKSSRSAYGNELWRQELYVDPVTNLLCRTDQLPEVKARRRVQRHAPKPPVEQIAIAADRELRLIKGLWYELHLVPLPEPEYRTVRELRKISLKGKYDRHGPFLEIEMDIRRLVSPPVRDVATGEMIEVGPACDDPDSWNSYRRGRPDRRYAVAKRVLSRRELRRQGLTNRPVDD